MIQLYNRILFIDTFTLLCLETTYTELNFDIWLDSLGYQRKHSQKAYILLRRKFGWKKVFIKKQADSISPELKLWLKINKNVIERHWKNEISDVEVVNIICHNKKV